VNKLKQIAARTWLTYLVDLFFELVSLECQVSGGQISLICVKTLAMELSGSQFGAIYRFRINVYLSLGTSLRY